jgi:hypothetical protein
MACSESEALALLNAWQKESKTIRFAFAGRGLLLWQEWGSIANVSGTTFIFSRKDSEFMMDAGNCAFEILAPGDAPEPFRYLLKIASLEGRTLQIKSRFGDIVLLIETNAH